MAISANFTADTDIIQKLDDNPNETDLDAAGLKLAFDTGAGNVVKAINNSLIPAINSEVSNTASTISGEIGTLENLTTSAKTDLVSAVNELDGRLDDLVYTEEVTLASNMTIAANTSPATQTKTLSPRTGYTPVMACLHNVYNGAINLWYCKVDGNQISWRVKNITGSSVTVDYIMVKVLYVRTSSVLSI